MLMFASEVVVECASCDNKRVVNQLSLIENTSHFNSYVWRIKKGFFEFASEVECLVQTISSKLIMLYAIICTGGSPNHQYCV